MANKGKATKKKNFRISVQGVDDVRADLKKLGYSVRQSRTKINKALRPAANKLVRAVQAAYKKEFNTFNRKRDGSRKPTWTTIGVITARKSKKPGLYVGPIKKRTTPIKVKGANSYNLAEMQILGNKQQAPRKDVFKETGKRMEQTIYLQAEKDLDKMINKLIKQAGF
jgi:hypothetical protein